MHEHNHAILEKRKNNNDTKPDSDCWPSWRWSLPQGWPQWRHHYWPESPTKLTSQKNLRYKSLKTIKILEFAQKYHFWNENKMAWYPNSEYLNDLTVKGRRTNVFATDAMLLSTTLTWAESWNNGLNTFNEWKQKSLFFASRSF